MNFRSIYFPIAPIKEFDSNQIAQFKELRNHLFSNNYEIIYYASDKYEYHKNLSHRYSGKFPYEHYHEFTDDTFSQGYLSKNLNNLLIIASNEFENVSREFGDDLYSTSHIIWEVSCLGFESLLKTLYTAAIIKPWFTKNNLLEDDCALFIDGNNEDFNKKVRKYLSSNHSNYNVDTVESYFKGEQNLKDYFQYYRPDINNEVLLNELLQGTLIVKLIKQRLNLGSYTGALLIRATEVIFDSDYYFKPYTISFLNETGDLSTQFQASITLKQNYSGGRFRKKPHEVKRYSDCPVDPNEEEDELYQAARNFTSDLYDKLNALSLSDAKEQLARVLVDALNANGKTQHFDFEKLGYVNHRKIGKLIINERYQIFLDYYEHIEIKMGRLPKALFFLFIRHPKGIYLKDLADHKEELYHLYLKVTNQSNTEKLRRNIELLCDLQDDSIYVNLSRIKAAFLNVVDDEFAKHYYPHGSRFSFKSIPLRRHLMDLPKALLE